MCGVKEIGGVLLRLTTCNWLSNSLPKLRLIITPPPLKRRDSRSAGYRADLCQYPSRFISWGYQGEYFSSSTRGKSEKFMIVDGGDRTHDPKIHGLSTTPFVKEISGVLVRLTTCNWLTNNSLPKLSLITVALPS